MASGSQAIPSLMTTEQLPILYSFRRCPYAMRARMALAHACLQVELREILLKAKPAEMLAVSSKGTVPVLQLPGGEVIDESLDVMRWALQQQDPEAWLASGPESTTELINENDGSFKNALDRYKYFTRFPEQPQQAYREQGEIFLQKLEHRLADNQGTGLVRPATSLADIAIFPFIRQFVNTDPGWFRQSPYPLLRAWLDRHVNSPLFQAVMKKYPLWSAGTPPLLIDWK